MVLAPERDCALIPLDPHDEAAGMEAPSLQVIGDRDRLSQILTNLLGNVVRHTPSGTPVEIAIGMAPPRTSPTAQPVVVVEVRDHGHGVPPEAAEKVFQRFYRSDTSRNRETGGSGLGLAIVLGIVAAHKGTGPDAPDPRRRRHRPHRAATRTGLVDPTIAPHGSPATRENHKSGTRDTVSRRRRGEDSPTMHAFHFQHGD